MSSGVSGPLESADGFSRPRVSRQRAGGPMRRERDRQRMDFFEPLYRNPPQSKKRIISISEFCKRLAFTVEDGLTRGTEISIDASLQRSLRRIQKNTKLAYMALECFSKEIYLKYHRTELLTLLRIDFARLKTIFNYSVSSQQEHAFLFDWLLLDDFTNNQ